MSDATTPPPPPPQPELSSSLLAGTFWMFAMRWAIRAVGFFSLMVLARLLNSKDFGLVALANSIAAFPGVILDFNMELAIIREREPSADYYNTAWTIRIMQMSFAAACVLVAGPFVAEAYADVRLTPLFQVLAFIIFLQGFENTWIISYRRDLKYRFDFAYNASTKLASAVIAVALAFLLRSYWALVYAQLVGVCFRLAFSFVGAPKMPRLSLREWHRLWSFSQWTLVRSVAEYAVGNVDRLILGRINGTAELGAYTLGRELADIPGSEISGPINRAVGPGLAKLQGQSQRLARALLNTSAAVAIAVFPIGVGLAAMSASLIPILLGKGWEVAIPVVRILALASLVTPLYGILGYALVIMGHNHTAAATMWLRALLHIILGILGAFIAGANGMAASILVAETFGGGTVLYFVHRYLPEFKLSSLASALLRPGMSALAMLMMLLMTNTFGPFSSVLVVGGQVALGALTYGAVLLFLWQISGRPKGPEALFLEKSYVLWSSALRPIA